MPNYGLIFNRRTPGSSNLDLYMYMIELNTNGYYYTMITHPKSGDQYRIIQRAIKTTSEPSPIYVIPLLHKDTIYYLTEQQLIPYIYKKDNDFFNFPVYIGRYNILSIYPTSTLPVPTGPSVIYGQVSYTFDNPIN